MILSDREIKAALERKSIEIDPDPRLDTTLWSSTALDLRLDRELIRWKDIGQIPDVCLDPTRSSGAALRSLLELYAEKLVIPDEGFIFHPRQFLLGWTIETLKLPERSRLGARVEGKSSLARMGIGVHVTAPTIHAGFGFRKSDPEVPGLSIQLEMWNVGTLPVRLKVGMRVCQLILEEVHGTPERGYEGQFRDQGPNLA